VPFGALPSGTGTDTTWLVLTVFGLGMLLGTIRGVLLSRGVTRVGVSRSPVLQHGPRYHSRRVD
jgi:hypothetical protein